MPTELNVHAVQKGPMQFAISDGEHAVTIDYPLPGGEGPMQGMTPLRLLLASLAGCSGSSPAVLLPRDGQPVSGIEVTACGQRREEHPTVFTSIDLEFVVREAVDPARVTHALALSEAQICPVWAMLKSSTPISARYSILAE